MKLCGEEAHRQQKNPLNFRVEGSFLYKCKIRQMPLQRGAVPDCHGSYQISRPTCH